MQALELRAVCTMCSALFVVVAFRSRIILPADGSIQAILAECNIHPVSGWRYYTFAGSGICAFLRNGYFMSFSFSARASAAAAAAVRMYTPARVPGKTLASRLSELRDPC